MRPILVTIALANLLNLLLDWMFIYGHLGAPADGRGRAPRSRVIHRPLGTAGGAALVLAWHDLRPALLPLRRDALEPAPLWRVLQIGAPIGAQMLLEYGAFGAVALLMGRIGTTAVAAHQVAINLASLTFMVPLGVGPGGRRAGGPRHRRARPAERPAAPRAPPWRSASGSWRSRP